jgi:serine/threonine protein kinase
MLPQGNIFIDDLGHARLGDFGIAIIGDETMTHSTSASAGTARWTAPERIIAQKQDRSLRFASDVWAFGCLFVLVRSTQLSMQLEELTTVMIALYAKATLPAFTQ